MKFKILIEKLGIRQNQLARKLQVSSQLITNWIKGRSQPQLEMINKLSIVLNISYEEIIECFIEKNKN